MITGKDDYQLRYPVGIVYSNSNTLLSLMAIILNTRVWCGRGILSSFASKGSEDGQSIEPSGFAVDKNNTVYVVDRGNFRIQTFVKECFWLNLAQSRGGSSGVFGVLGPSLETC